MTIEQVIMKSADEIDNKATADQRKILSRLILQRMMSSDATKYLAPESFEKVSKQLLSDTPDAKIEVAYKYLENRQSYYSTIASLTVSWAQSPAEINDLDGNVWSTYALSVAVNVGNNYGSDLKKFAQIAECTSSMQALIEELQAMVPEPIRVMVLDSDGRIARDNKRYYDGVCEKLLNTLWRGTNRRLRTGLRRGGSSRPIARDAEMLANVKPGRYEVSIDDGSRRRPNVKTYLVYVPENPTWLASIKRIA